MGPESGNPARDGELNVTSRTDVVDVRQKVRELCESLDFSLSETTRVVTATSELARNIIEFAGSGKISWNMISEKNGTGAVTEKGLELVFKDEGPGIDDLDWAMRDGTSTGDGLGKGLPGAEKLMDEMDVKTDPDLGTRITVKKWSSSGRE